MSNVRRDLAKDLAFLTMYDEWIDEEPSQGKKDKLRDAQASWARYFYIDLITRTRVRRPYLKRAIENKDVTHD